MYAPAITAIIDDPQEFHATRRKDVPSTAVACAWLATSDGRAIMRRAQRLRIVLAILEPSQLSQFPSHQPQEPFPRLGPALVEPVLRDPSRLQTSAR